MIYQEKMTNICCFQLHRCENLLYFSVLSLIWLLITYNIMIISYIPDKDNGFIACLLHIKQHELTWTMDIIFIFICCLHWSVIYIGPVFRDISAHFFLSTTPSGPQASCTHTRACTNTHTNTLIRSDSFWICSNMFVNNEAECIG